MRELGRIVVQIPARGGSKRVPAKNLRLLAGKPMIAYAIATAKGCDRLENVFVNTDSSEIEEVARAFGAKVYRRPVELGSDTASGDAFTADFIEKLNPDTLVMISPVCPLVEVQDIDAALSAYCDSTCDTLISCEETRMQTFCEGRAINIRDDEPLAATQGNPPVQILNWAIAIWDARTYRENYQRDGYAYLGQSRLLFPLPSSRCLKVSYPDDMRMAERLIATTANCEQRLV